MNGRKWSVFGLVFIIIVLVYGAIPFHSIPTLGQVVWDSGFAQSFVNAGWPSSKAINFGLPINAPVVEGLAGVFLQSTFIKFFGMHPADAYALGAVIWLALALWGSIKLGRLLGAGAVQSAFLSLIYLTLPMVWWHAQYATLSFGFAFLPLYLFSGFRVVYSSSDMSNNPHKWIITAAFFIGVSLLAVFMDGYTFVMLFSACGALWVTAFTRKDVTRKDLLIRALPTMLLSALTAYFTYTRYVGTMEFSSSSLDFFRGWGVDLAMLFVPSRGVSWLWDTLGLSVLRNDQTFFGDASVWITTFALPLLVAGGAGYWLCRKQRFALPLLLVTLLGLYFSLGPSLKVNSVRPADANGEYLVQGREMPAAMAVMPTGSAFISSHIPGFINMRATYRWSGLMFTGLFGLIVLFFQKASSRGSNLLGIVVVAFLIVSNLPNLPRRWIDSRNNRTAMFLMDRDFASLSRTIGKGGVVFFAPPGNDFIVNYLAASGNYYTYNIGGDKNLEMSYQYWPDVLKTFPRRKPGSCFDEKISLLLQDKLADFVVIPYFDLLWGAHIWPWPENDVNVKREEFSATVRNFEANPAFSVAKDELYSVISLSPSAGNGLLPRGIKCP
jgi:hypothetical protein